MTPSPEPSDREIDRQFRSINRRLERLEDTQITGQELYRAFDRVYEEIDIVEGKVDNFRAEFEIFREEVNGKLNEVNGKFDEVNGKLDTILRHITGIN